jgi:NAD-dependent deacetylase
MKKVVVLTGAGISAESGLRTFRDSGGLWEKYDLNEVATPEAWIKNQKLVLEFYNERRKQALEAKPNDGHHALVSLEKKFDVTIITQNIDNLHEKAGSSCVIHIHGEIMKAQSSLNPELVYPLDDWKLNIGQKCEAGSQLRPNVVWFGEPVPKMLEASEITRNADIFIVIGTSLNVYPAAGLIDVALDTTPKYLIDPQDVSTVGINNIEHIREKASKGVPQLANSLLKNRN